MGLLRKSPFAKSTSPKEIMKAILVNNNIFHADFEAAVVGKDNLKAA